jgi:trimeric autotransporter adhesin
MRSRSKWVGRETGKLLGGVSLVVLLGTGLSWAGPPNPTQSDNLANTAGGSGALLNNTTGTGNTGFGDSALLNNQSGNYNTAIGVSALLGNTEGMFNTAIGFVAGGATGNYNTASGDYALFSNTGDYNTANGFGALYSNTGDYNTASGVNALHSTTNGGFNTASGVNGLFYTTGAFNTAVGLSAGLSNTTGSSNTFIGAYADANAGMYTNGTALGYGAELTASNSIMLGNSSINRIYAYVPSITGISDRRLKKDIRPLDADLGLDFVQKLQPVSYRFKNGDETERYGFIAQDLEQALPVPLHDIIEGSEPEHGLALIERQHDKDRTYRVSYGELTAPIVKAIQQVQQEIEAERQQNADLRHVLATMGDQFAALKAQNDALRHSIEVVERVTTSR